MAMDIFGAANSLIGGIGGYMQGKTLAAGSKMSAEYYGKEADLYGKVAQYSQLETGIKEQMATRSIYQTIGMAKSAIGASGIKESGSAADILRSSAQQGSLTKALIETQGNMEYSGYLGQQEAATAQQQAALSAAKAQSSSGTFSLIGGVVGMLGSLFSDDRLKTDIEFVNRRPDGLGIYRFRFNSGGPLFEGVMASEVETLYPKAVQYNDMGFRMIDYEAIGVEMKTVGSVN